MYVRFVDSLGWFSDVMPAGDFSRETALFMCMSRKDINPFTDFPVGTVQPRGTPGVS